LIANVAVAVSTKCSTCGTEAALNHRWCDVCQTDVGFPNVRFANQVQERAQLAKRLTSARLISNSPGTIQKRKELREIVGRSSIVFNRHLGTLHTWLMSSNPLFLSFYDQLQAGRRPEDNTWDRQRTSAENTVSPFFYKDLSVAVLGPQARGMPYYGPYTVTLRKETLVHRASVFEKNPFFFCEQHGLVSGTDTPAGYRATWDKRQSLAIAKLTPKLEAQMTSGDLAELVMEKRGGEADCEFIEVHIYGPVHRDSIETVSGPIPDDPEDKIIWNQVKRKLGRLNVAVEEVKDPGGPGCK
jgi:hypothetical protein